MMTVASSTPDRADLALERVVQQGIEAHPDDIAELKERILRKDFVPSTPQLYRLFDVAGAVGLLEVVEKYFNADYTTWLDRDVGDREYGGPPIKEHEDLHPED